MHSNGNMGQPSRSQNFLIGDVNGHGKAEMVQIWMSKNATLNLVVYGLTTNGLATLYAGNIGGYVFDVLGWLISDVDGNGNAEIIQLNNDYSSVSMNIYHWVNGTISMLGPYLADIASAESWLVDDIDGDGRAEISQQWDNEGQLGDGPHLSTDRNET